MGLLRKLINCIALTPEHLGQVGESKIEKDLDFANFFGYKGECLRNVYIPKRDGSTAEIDLLYITSKGIFVIESKNYSGYIFGDEDQQYWTATLYAGKNWYGGKEVNKYRFYNPIRQNASHIRALRDYLGNVRTFSIIVFGNKCELKSVTYYEGNSYICFESDLRDTIKKIWKQNDDIYSKEAQIDIFNRLVIHEHGDDEIREKHVNDIYEAQNGMTCPRCGGRLVLRTAKSGPNAGNSFYGCSNYPRCRYIRNIDGH